MWIFAKVLSYFSIITYIYFAAKKKPFPGSRFEHRYGGVYAFRLNSNKQKIDIKLGISFDASISVIFSRENAFDRFLKAIGVCHEFQIEHGSFDQKVLIASHNHALRDALIKSQVLRDTILEIMDFPLLHLYKKGVNGETARFALRAKALTIADGFIWITFADQSLDLLDTVAGETLVSKMKIVADELKKVNTSPHDRLYVVYRVFVALTFALCLLAYDSCSLRSLLPENSVQELSWHNTIMYSAGVIAGLLLFATVFAILFFQRSPLLSRVIRRLYSIWPLTFSMFVTGQLFSINVAWDMDRGVARTLLIREKWEVRKSKGGVYHRMRFDGLTRNGASTVITVPDSVYRDYESGEEITVILHRGFLHDPWVKFPEY
ncbi:MAG: hypothetical protein LWW75_03350 [Chlorobiales bacterium]|nr:hypothetical protein [Chlorobiales bacterium]